METREWLDPFTGRRSEGKPCSGPSTAARPGASTSCSTWPRRVKAMPRRRPSDLRQPDRRPQGLDRRQLRSGRARPGARPVRPQPAVFNTSSLSPALGAGDPGVLYAGVGRTTRPWAPSAARTNASAASPSRRWTIPPAPLPKVDGAEGEQPRDPWSRPGPPASARPATRTSTRSGPGSATPTRRSGCTSAPAPRRSRWPSATTGANGRQDLHGGGETCVSPTTSCCRSHRRSNPRPPWSMTGCSSAFPLLRGGIIESGAGWAPEFRCAGWTWATRASAAPTRICRPCR